MKRLRHLTPASCDTSTMDAYEAIISKRDVRHYSDSEISDELGRLCWGRSGSCLGSFSMSPGEAGASRC